MFRLSNAKPVCGWCNRSSEDLLECPCHKVFYCSNVCQEHGWSRHRKVCDHRMIIPFNAPGTCASCGVLSTHLKSCQCGFVMYCDQWCQKAHWLLHQHQCVHYQIARQRSKVLMRDSWTQTLLTSSHSGIDASSPKASLLKSNYAEKSGGEVVSRKFAAQRLALEKTEESNRELVCAAEAAALTLLYDKHSAIAGQRLMHVQDEERKGRLSIMAKYTEFLIKRDTKWKSYKKT